MSTTPTPTCVWILSSYVYDENPRFVCLSEEEAIDLANKLNKATYKANGEATNAQYRIYCIKTGHPYDSDALENVKMDYLDY